jgi:hypothetical protein
LDGWIGTFRSAPIETAYQKFSGIDPVTKSDCPR